MGNKQLYQMVFVPAILALGSGVIFRLRDLHSNPPALAGRMVYETGTTWALKKYQIQAGTVICGKNSETIIEQRSKPLCSIIIIIRTYVIVLRLPHSVMSCCGIFLPLLLPLWEVGARINLCKTE